MVRYVDPDAGFATFTRGRSLCVRLQRGVEVHSRPRHAAGAPSDCARCALGPGFRI